MLQLLDFYLSTLTGGDTVSSESFSARRNIYLNSHKDDVAVDSAESPPEKQAEKNAEENEVDSTIAEDTLLNDGQVD